MTVNQLLVKLQYAQLKCEGKKEVKVCVDFKWYTVQGMHTGPDNAVLVVRKDAEQ